MTKICNARVPSPPTPPDARFRFCFSSLFFHLFFFTCFPSSTSGENRGRKKEKNLKPVGGENKNYEMLERAAMPSVVVEQQNCCVHLLSNIYLN